MGEQIKYLDYSGLQQYHQMIQNQLPTNKQAANNGSDLSLVTTGEKYTWNNKQDAIVFNTSYNASSNKAATMSDIPSVMGASGSNHAPGLVPDPGSTAGITKFLREDGTWAEPSGSSNGNAAYFSNDSGEGVVPSDGIRVETVSAAATMSINPDVVTVISGNVGTAAITLQVPNDNLAHVWDILMTTDSSVSVTIALSNNATIKVPSGFAIGTSKSMEISVVGVGSTYYLRYGEFS